VEPEVRDELEEELLSDFPEVALGSYGLLNS